MPGSARRLGAVCEELPLERIAERLIERDQSRRSAIVGGHFGNSSI
jgi:hypothetical protein